MQAEGAPRKAVAVRPEVALRTRQRLFAALEEAFPIAFSPAGLPGARAEIAIDGEAPSGGLPTLVFEDREGGHPRRSVRLGEREAIDPRIRGVELSDGVASRVAAAGEEQLDVLASSGSQAVWTRTRGEPATQRIASSPPELEPTQTLRDLLVERPLALVGLIAFLREVCGDAIHEQPPLRAAILFDDPNLRWRTYGFIDYRRLLGHADAHGYHASMAMIPLDGGRQHGATVELFRKRPDRLSLVLHGNNHVTGELMRVADDTRATAIAAQALRRADRFESRYGLRIDRVMTAPHGMCSPSVARAMARLRFDALCAIHPLPWTEFPPPDRPLAGWDPAEFAAGCAVIPRLPLTADAAEIALRAYLGQPVILYGHHWDLADGLDLLAEKASQVNRMGAVRWCSPGAIAESNFATSSSGAELSLEAYSHRLRLTVPGNASSLTVERPRGLDEAHSGWADHRDGVLRSFDEPTPIDPGTLELRLLSGPAIDPADVPPPGSTVWPRLRRAATETRDRLRPLIKAG